MFELIIPLNHILLDPEQPVDLTALPLEEARELIKASYGFLSPAVRVTIEDNLAHVSLDEPRADRIAAALDSHHKGIKAAQKADYPKAIALFTKVIQTLPHHVDARRNLAMAHLEQGKPELAKKLLQECLKIDSNNVWTFLLLGNIYAKYERKPDVAAFYYETGLSLSPSDNILLNNFAALEMERGRIPAARSLFEKALLSDPSYPNTYYGLALVHRTNHAPEDALMMLDHLFEQPRPEDSRGEPVYQKARELYAELCSEVASQNSEHLMASVIIRKGEIERDCGHPISIEEDSSLEYVSAMAQMAWKHGRSEHRVRYRMRSAAITPHLVAHELEHIELEHKARMVGRNRVFITTRENREEALRSIGDHIAKLHRQGYAEATISEVMTQMIHGLCNQVFNCPIDMMVEHRLFHNSPGLRSSQFASMRLLHDEALKTYTNPEIRRLTPPPHLSCQRHVELR